MFFLSVLFLLKTHFVLDHFSSITLNTYLQPAVVNNFTIDLTQLQCNRCGLYEAQ